LYPSLDYCPQSELFKLRPIPADYKSPLNNTNGSNDRLSNIGACNTASWPPNINPTDEANAPLIYAAIGAKCSDDGQFGFWDVWDWRTSPKALRMISFIRF
jgi:hypothetical protein